MVWNFIPTQLDKVYQKNCQSETLPKQNIAKAKHCRCETLSKHNNAKAKQCQSKTLPKQNISKVKHCRIYISLPENVHKICLSLDQFVKDSLPGTHGLQIQIC